MLALDVVLDVACCKCGKTMAVTVRCEGDGLIDGSDAKALARLDCIHCRCTNYVIFAPETGEVVDIDGELRVVREYEPSLN